MMKKLEYGIVIAMIILCFFTVNVYAYENSIFKIDVPEDYKEFSYEGLYMFVKSEDKAIIIYSMESEGLKKDISTMSKTEIKELIDSVLKDDVTVIEQSKEKLGKAKAIKARTGEDNDFTDMYIVVSDKHILMICFSATTESELDSVEFLEIKDSFEMKEKTTNTTFIEIAVVIIVLASIAFKFRKKFMRY